MTLDTARIPSEPKRVLQSMKDGGKGDVNDPDSDLDNMPSLTISLTNRDCQMTGEEVHSMPVQQFAELWAVSP